MPKHVGLEAEVLRSLVLDKILPTQKLGDGFVSPEELAESVDLSVGHSPVLMPRQIIPKPVSRCQNGTYVIYDVGWQLDGDSKHRWGVKPDVLKVHRARFLIQSSLIYQDLVMGVGTREDAPAYFRHWTGASFLHVAPELLPWRFRDEIVPLYFPDGVWLPDRDDNPLGRHIAQHFVHADGSIEVPRVAME